MGNFCRRQFLDLIICFFLFCFTCLTCLNCLTSCGLETLYYLEPPASSREVLDNDDRNLDYFAFSTGDNSDVGGDFRFQGTGVYYKIFASKSDATSSYSSISSSNSSSDVSAAANYIINSRKYVPLLAAETTNNPFITDQDRTAVTIRLNRYDNAGEPNGVYIDGTRRFTPIRNVASGGRNFGFEFTNDDNDHNPVPKSTDTDVSMSGSSNSSGEWYVDVWAFTMGKDASYSPSYSKGIHLGCIKIEESEYNK